MSGIKYITGKDLMRRRGWSSPVIAEFLGQADKTDVKRFHSNTFTISLFSVERVEEAESDPEWQALADGQYFVRRKAERTESRANAMDRVRNFDIRIRNSELSRPFLVNAAIANYNERKTYQRTKQGLSPHVPIDATTAPASTVVRLTLNYLRHNLTNYDRAIKDLAVAEGPLEEYKTLRARFFTALRKAFPDFAEMLTIQESGDFEHDYVLYKKSIPKR